MSPEAQEIDLETLDEATKAKLLKTGLLISKLSADPKHRRKALELIKAAAPETSIPELDMEEAAGRIAEERTKPVMEENKSLREEFNALKTSLQRDKWREAHGLTEEDLVEVEELAKDKGITKADTAVDFWRTKNQIGTPRSTRQNKGAQDYHTELGKIPPTNGAALKAAAFRQADKVLREMRGRRLA
jgi:hypothetical protein